MLPAILLGVFTMWQSNIPQTIWLGNFIVLIIAGVSSYFFLSKKNRINTNSSVIFIVGITLLLLTFIDNGIGNIHRWVSIGPIKLNIGSLVLPILLIELGKALNFKNWWLLALLTLGIITLLLFQPDASKTTAFAIASIILLKKNAVKNVQFYVLGLPILASILAWYILDNLPSVDYVEEILHMTKKIGVVWFILSVLSLAILPLPFFFFKTGINRTIFISLGAYFSIVLLSTLFGNFPVPLLGYGISPIIGYAIAITWMIKNTEAEA